MATRIVRRGTAPLSSRPQAYPSVRPGMLPGQGVRKSQTVDARQVEHLKQPEVWTMFDTLILSAAVVPPAAAALNYAGYASPQVFFNGRTQVNSSLAITSMTTTSGYVDFPYKGFGIGVDVFSDTDQASAGGVANAAAFIETMINYSSVVLQFAGDQKFVFPLSDCPGGGGVYWGPKTDSRVLGGAQVAGSATNGFPSLQARNIWSEYILFRGDKTPFNVQLVTTAGGVARIQSLQALAAPFQSGIRIKFWGYRGKALILGAPFRG